MKNAWEGWQLATLGHLGENAILKSHSHCLLSEEEKTNPNLFTCLPQTLVAGTTEVVWKRRHAPEVWTARPSGTPCASHDRNVPPTNRGGFTFKPLRTIKAHPSSPKYVHFDIFIVVEKGLHKSYTVSLTLAPLGPEQTGWLSSHWGYSLPWT